VLQAEAERLELERRVGHSQASHSEAATELSRKIEDLEAQLAEARRGEREATASVTEERERGEAAARDGEELRAEMVQMQAQHGQRLSAAAEQHQQQLEDLQAALDAANATITEQAIEIERLKALIAELRATIAAVSKDNADKDEQLQELSAKDQAQAELAWRVGRPTMSSATWPRGRLPSLPSCDAVFLFF
jgi:chromosome segregation ATPase